MQVELTEQAQQLVKPLLPAGHFQSANEAVEQALEYFVDRQPTKESFRSKLREAHQAHEAGQSVQWDIPELKTELHKRIHDSQNAR